MGQMMAGAAHELNNPLTAILGVSELLHERAPDDASKRHLDLILQQTRRAAAIVQNLLAFSRPSAQSRSAVHLEEIVQQVLQVAQSSLRAKNISVSFESPGPLPAVLGDAKLLAQVFSNIITNAQQAISASGAPGHLRVSLASSGERVMVTIADDGMGIAGENMGKSSTRFLLPSGRAEAPAWVSPSPWPWSKSTTEQSTLNRSPGPEPRFKLFCPRWKNQHRNEIHPPKARKDLLPEDSLAGRTALIVDDEEGIREIVQEGLSARGMKVEQAGTAEEALTLLANADYDVVLCDVNLPKLSGEEFFDELRKRKKSSLPHFVFITGELVDSERVAEIGRKGASILQKPFRVPAVAKLLASLLQLQPSKAV